MVGRPVKGKDQRGLGRPPRTFRAIGSCVLLVGAIGGVAIGYDRYTTTAEGARLAVDSNAAAHLAVDNGAESAAAKLAQAKAKAAAAAAAAKAKRANDLARAERSASQTQVRTNYPVPSSCSEYSGNRALGCALLLEVGFGLDQMPCLEQLWTRESGWNPKSTNRSSGAYGIPQALPGTKMAVYGADWQTNPVTQIKWGLDYIKNRYKTPCNAWGHFQTYNWY